MNIEFEAKVRLTVEPNHETGKSRHVSTDVMLDIDNRLDAGQYMDDKEMPNQTGCHTLTNVLVQGLLANIHSAHQKGYKDSAEHLRYIISELERGFVQQVKIEDGAY